MKRPLLLGALALCFVPAAAATTRGSLPSPTVPIRLEPPLRTATTPFSATERRFPRRLDASVSVQVGIDGAGRPVRVTALDRIVVDGAGDYSFSIPAPATRVVAGPGSASQPGLRSGTVLWQGFSAGRRVLVAKISLDAARAAKALPVQLAIGPEGIRIRNATATTVTATVGPAPRTEVAAALRSAYDAVRNRTPIAAQPIGFTGRTRAVKRIVRARVRVTGTYRFSNDRPRTLAAWVSDEPLRLPGKGALRALDLRATVEPAIEPLRRPVRDVAEASLLIFESALASQYETYLANPDPAGKSATSYRFTLAPKATAAGGGNDGSSSPWLEIAVAAVAVLTIGGALVLWAHS